MKKILTLIMTLVIVFCSMPFGAINVNAETEHTTIVNGVYIYYYLVNGEAIIKDCSTSILGSFIIPSTLEDYPVTCIDDLAFNNCSHMSSITIPSCIKRIGKDAFLNCNNLVKVNITDFDAWCNIDFENISSNPLVYGKKLYINGILATDVIISDSVKIIKDNLFYNCDSLLSVTIPESVISIGKNAFYNCNSLCKVNITDITAWCNINFEDNPLSYANNLYLNNVLVTDLVIPNSVTNIYDYAFCGCDSLTSVYIPDDVKSIGSYAFRDCSSLTSITIPDSVNSIGSSAFYNTKYYNDSNNWEKDVLYIDNHLIDSKKSVSGTYIIKSNIITIANYAFYDCGLLTGVKIPNSVKSIGEYAFDSCKSLQAVEIPNSVLWIGFCSFSNCKSLISITLGNSITNIGDSAFSHCTSLTSITIPDSVINLSESAFYNCYNLTSITFGKGLKNIGKNSFYNCISLINVNIIDIAKWCGITFEDTPLLYMENLYLNGIPTTEIVLPNGITHIENFSFFGCNMLTSITIPNSVTSIGKSAFYNCTSLNKVNIIDLETWCNIDFEDYYSNPLYYAKNLHINGTLATNVTIPESVTKINDYVFQGCSSLTRITIPNSVTSIGNAAFYNCTSLNKVNITDLETWCNIDFYSNDSNPLYYANNLYINETLATNIAIPYSVEQIKNYVFSGCSSLTSITIPDSVTRIADYAFYGCSSLTSISIPDSVKSIGSVAFEYCSLLTSITIPDSVTRIGYNAFYDTGYYKNLGNWENNVLYIDNHLIDAKTELSGFYNIKSGTKIVADEAFLNCSSLTSITIPNSVTIIGEEAFRDCSSLTYLIIPESVTSIGERAFINCDYLSSITIPDSVTNIGYNAFYSTRYYNNSNNWENNVLYIGHHLISAKTVLSGSYVIKLGTKTIACDAFQDCSSLTYLIIPESVTSIGERAFINCDYLSSITIPDSVTNIGYNAFYSTRYYNNSNNWENNVLYIGHHLISAKTVLSGSYVIKLGTKTIACDAFQDCSSVTTITIPDSVTSIGGWAFSDCNLLEAVYYCGTYYDWNEISIGDFNSNLTNAIRYYHLYDNDCDTICNICGHFRLIYITGDLNGDDKINSADVIIIKKALLDKLSAEEIITCDINGDGGLNILDLIKLKKSIAE